MYWAGAPKKYERIQSNYLQKLRVQIGEAKFIHYSH